MEEKEKPTGAEPETVEVPQTVPLPDAKPAQSQPGIKDRFRAFWRIYRDKKLITIPLTIVLLAGLLFVVPYTRYMILGQFIQKEFKFTVIDSVTNKPVSGATIEIGQARVDTDANGTTKVKIKVGPSEVKVSKIYFKAASQKVLVGLSGKSNTATLKLTAIGRQVPVTVINKITGKPVANAVLSAAGSEVKTDKSGRAVIVLPANNKTAEVTISLKGYNDGAGTVVVTEQQDKVNHFQITPSGRVYFLSRLSGKIDVVKTNLDGGDRHTVLAGTGKEDNHDTILLASRDWRYLALKSKRDGGDNAKLFLIDTSNDKVTTMDEGNAGFTLIGWADHRFVYEVQRHGYKNWQPKSEALKSYDATTGKITVITETDGEGTNEYDYAKSGLGTVTLLGNEIVFYKNWYTNYYTAYKLTGKSVSLVSVKADGSGRKTVRDFPVPPGTSYFSLEARLYEPRELYLKVPPADNAGKYSYYEYEDGKITAKPDVSDDTFGERYPTYLASPDSKQTFWSDPRDGKNVLFVGDAAGGNEKQVAALSDYRNYGWFTNDYLLVSKNDSELAIMPVSGGTPLKISDYHKPAYDFVGYGGGYGGL